MASDMVVALARATTDGVTLFGHNSNRPHGEAASLVLTPGREHSPGETMRATYLDLPQTRHTWTVLGGRASGAWGYVHGVNEKGVAIGCTAIDTRLACDEPCLTGPDLVRLGLERAATACQAMEAITDLICRYGQGGVPGQQGSDSALLIADNREAYALEASGRHWVLAQVGSVRAVCGTCMLRQDWDRIARGLADLAITRGWWPEDGCKLDFAGALGRPGPEHARVMRRWGRATLTLEEHSGQVDLALLRRLLGEQAELASRREGELEEGTASSLIVRLGPAAEDLPVAWCAFGTPAAGLYLPLFPFGQLPEVYEDDSGTGSPLWRGLEALGRDARRDRVFGEALHTALANLQQRLDEHILDFIEEARLLHRQEAHDALRRLAGSFMQHSVERLEEVLDTVRSRPGEPTHKPPELVVQGANF
jgi:dipeptidase